MVEGHLRCCTCYKGTGVMARGVVSRADRRVQIISKKGIALCSSIYLRWLCVSERELAGCAEVADGVQFVED